MSLKQTIAEIVEKHLPDESHFVVDVELNEKDTKSRIRVLIDSDHGVSIQTCALVSRAVGEEIEAKELLEDAYILEVSSPGLDHPLSSRRQYQNNIGRNIKVSLVDGTEIEGQLFAVDQFEIVIMIKKKEKGKKVTEEAVKVALEQIKKSIVLVSFK